MKIEFDPDKDASNIAKHGISLRRAVEMKMLKVERDVRFDGEERFRAWGTIDDAGYCLAFTIRDGVLRPISLRRAHEKELRRNVR